MSLVLGWSALVLMMFGMGMGYSPNEAPFKYIPLMLCAGALLIPVDLYFIHKRRK